MRRERETTRVRVYALLPAAILVVLALTATTALALPAGRVYDMVSPVYKGGYGVLNIQGVALNGESVAYYGEGSFAGAPISGPDGAFTSGYLARRGASGWSTTPTMAPAALDPAPQAGDLSPSLDEAFSMGHPGPGEENSVQTVDDLLLHSTAVPDTNTGWEPLGSFESLNTGGPLLPVYVASSLDFCHILLTAGESEPLAPEAVGATQQLYEFDRGCGEEARSLTLVGLNNKDKLIDPACYTSIGGEFYRSPGSAFNAVSADGEEVFFTVCTTATNPYGPEVPHQVYVRLAGSKTLEVSRPLSPVCVAGGVATEVPCEGATARASADFAGASEDGSRVYFTAPLAGGQSPLVPGDTDASNNLYLASIGCPVSKPDCGTAEREVTGLTEVSHDPRAGQAAEVLGVVKVAPDGTRAYFVAGGDMLTMAQQQALESEGRPVPQAGTPNFYVYDSSTGTTAFIGDLSGADQKLWDFNESEAQTAGAHGQFLVFTTYAQLLSSDTNAARDVYRYDAETGQLNRVSGGEEGYDDNGNHAIRNAQGELLEARIAPAHEGGRLRAQYEIDNRAISEDGSRIVFTTAEPLSPLATNGLENVYEWHESPGGVGEGGVSLVSSGDSEAPVNDVVISPSGRDIFFVTTQGLVPQDNDGVGDVYDARLDGGFPVAPEPATPCSGDACQGPLTNPAPLLVPGSVAQAPGDEFSPPSAGKAKPSARSAKRCGKGRVKQRGRCVKSKASKKAKSNRKGSK